MRLCAATPRPLLDRLEQILSTNAEEVLGYDSSLPSNVQQWQSFNDEYSYDLAGNMVGEVTQEQRAPIHS